MKPSTLDPAPEYTARFNSGERGEVPVESGCYVIANFTDDILYIGKSKNLNGRMGSHLDSDKKDGDTPAGRAFWFYYRLCLERDMANLETSWINQHVSKTGGLPYWNKQYPAG